MPEGIEYEEEVEKCEKMDKGYFETFKEGLSG